MRRAEKRRERLARTVERGSAAFSPHDLAGVLAKERGICRKALKLGGFFAEFKLLWAMLQDYKSGAYPQVPWKLIAAVGFAMLYLLNPFDLIPDLLPLVGYTDDFSVFGLVLAGFKSEIDAYRRWREKR